MKTALLKVRTEPGLFSTEYVVTFRGKDREHSVIVDREDVRDGRLRVYLLDRGDDLALIHLPRETLDAGSRVIVPTSELEGISDLTVSAA